MTSRRKAEMMNLAQEFEDSVGSLVQHLSAAAQQMEATARSMAATSEQTNQQSNTVAAAAEETSANVQAVAAATEELAASAGEIGSQVTHTSRVAAKAVENTQQTNGRVQALAQGAQKIGDVVALINTIAGQTNLLARSYVSGRLDARQEVVDFAAKILGVARQFLRRGEDLRSGGAGLAGAALHIEDVPGHYLRALSSLLHVAGDLARGPRPAPPWQPRRRPRWNSSHRWSRRWSGWRRRRCASPPGWRRSASRSPRWPWPSGRPVPLTSVAITAKPRPASPARAASMVAFRARRFV
jgi:hypothetical protein